MRNNRCFKLIVLLLTLSFTLAVTLSVAMARQDTYQTGVMLEETVLDETFVKSALITDGDGKEMGDPASADPNAAYTLHLSVKEPDEPANAEEMLPSSTDEVSVVYKLNENLKAVDGGNTVVSWTYYEDDSLLEFSWVGDKPSEFSAEIQVIPHAPTDNDLSGSYVLVTKTNVMVGFETYSDKGRGKLKSSQVKIENGMLRPDMTEDPVWVLKHVSGNYYTVYSQNAGAYLKLELPNHARLEDVEEAQAQKLLVESRNGGYTFRFSGKGLNNSGNNATGGFACYDAGNANNETFTLYSTSSVIDAPTYNLSGTWAVSSAQRKRILSSNSSASGRLKAISYENLDGTLLPYDNVTYWTFENVIRDWYVVSTDGGYLNISSSGVSVSGTPQKLQATSDDDFNTFILKSSDNYGVRSVDDNSFNASTNGLGDSYMHLALRSATSIHEEDANISGTWGITTSFSGAALVAKANGSNKLKSVAYGETSDGFVYSVEEPIEEWEFTQINGNWYTVRAQNGQYLSVSKDKVILTNEESKVYIQKKDGMYRITDGNIYALSNSGGNPKNGYIAYGKSQAADNNEWLTLRSVSPVNAQLIFSVNGGTAAAAPETVVGETGERVSLPNLDSTKDGQEFLGWAEVNDIFAINPGKNLRYHELYKPGTTYELKGGTNTLYAIYNQQVRKVQFGIRADGVIQDEPNDYSVSNYIGHFTVDGILKEGHWVIDIDSTKPVNGYYLENDVTNNLNWVPSAEQIAAALKKEGNVVFDPETQYVHYYVMKTTGVNVWKVDGVIRNKAKVAITYNTNITGAAKTDIKNMPGSKQVVSGTEIMIGVDDDGNVLRPVRKGYVFKGWNTAPDGSGTYYSAGRYMRLRSNLNLYAQWEEGVLSIDITPDWPEGKPAPSGTMITLTAELTGFDDLVEGEDYILQWQYSTDLENWIDEPGAHDITFTYELNTTTAQYTWKVAAVEPQE